MRRAIVRCGASAVLTVAISGCADDPERTYVPPEEPVPMPDQVCAPGAAYACYGGPAETEGVGPCTAGLRTCNAWGNAYGPCVGEVSPATEACGTGIDESCDGRAQCTGDAVFSLRFGDAGMSGMGVRRGPEGDLLVGGWFSGSIDLGTGSMGLPTEVPWGSFIGRLDPEGQPRWAMSSADAWLGILGAWAEGDLFLTGVLGADTDLYGVPLPGPGGIVVAALDPSGTAHWARRYGDGSEQYVRAAEAGTAGLYLTGYTQGILDLGGQTAPLVGEEGCGNFVALVDGHGEGIWSRMFFGETDKWQTSLALAPGGEVILAGPMHGTVDLGAGWLPGGPDLDVFVATYDAEGAYVWGARFGDAEHDQTATALVTDAQGDAIVAGTFGGTLDFGGGAMTASGSADVFLVALDPKGAPIWSHAYPSGAPTTLDGLAIDDLGNLVLSGTYSATYLPPIDFGCGALPPSGATPRMFVAKLDPEAHCIWSRSFGPKAGGRAAVDGLGNVLLAGNFEDTLDLGAGTMTSIGEADAFLAKLAP